MPAPIPAVLTTPTIGTLAGVSLYNGTTEELTRTIVGQYRRTIDGTMRADVIAQKRSWNIKLQFLTNAQFTALDTVYTNANGGQVGLTLNSVGATVFVYLKSWKATRVKFAGPDGFESDGRHLTFTAEEA